MKKTILKIAFTFISIVMLLAVGTIIYIYQDISGFAKTPFKIGSPDITFTILRGQSLGTIAENLEKEGLISDSFYFSVYAKFKKYEKHFKTGEYILSASKSPQEILDILIKGLIKRYKIIIYEGLTIKDIANILEKNKLCDSARFTELCYDADFIKKLGLTDDPVSLEGYLFPDTYIFSRQNTCEQIITTMVNKFKTVFIPEWKKRAEKLNFSVHEIVIMASMIEKETAYDSERPLISSVFHNRIKKRMRFQSDPTAVYGLNNFSGKIQQSHIRANTPYNTYRINGFPPGPISNPGEASLKAALYPAKTDYLYFVSKDGLTHHFSKTYAEHLSAINKYLRNSPEIVDPPEALQSTDTDVQK